MTIPTPSIIHLPLITYNAALDDFLLPDVFCTILPSVQQRIIEHSTLSDTTDPNQTDSHPNSALSKKVICTDEDWLNANEITKHDNSIEIKNLEFTSTNPAAPKLTGILTNEKKRLFAELYLPDRVRLHAENPFGKDNLSQCFMSQPVFRHTLIILIKSGYLSNNVKKLLSAAMPQFRTLLYCFRRYQAIDFSPLRVINPDWHKETAFVPDRIAMTTSALLYYDGDVASVIRYVGGSHTYGDIDVTGILRNLKTILKPETYNDLERIYRQGCPAKANIQDTETNYQAFRKFGNHQAATDHAHVLRKALIKTSRRGLMLMATDLIADFCPNVHFNPVNVVDVDHSYRKPRSITNCSGRPEEWCFAVNDWTSKDDEPTLTFAGAFTSFIVFIYNLAITYPYTRKACARDDIQNAFPRLKHNPNVAGMYSVSFDGYWCINTSQTFGENTSPSNFDVTARARAETSQAKWFEPDIIEQAAPYLPPTPEPTPMSPTELASMTQATRDSINQGVLDVCGNRKPPTFNHHVDDNMYGDVASLLRRAASASVIGAYEVFGYPQDPLRGPDPITWEKWPSELSHIDEPVGYGVDMHRLVIYLPSTKRQKLANIMQPWLQMKTFTLRLAAELVGSLIHAAQTNREIKALFFCLQNAFRKLLQAQSYRVRAWYKRMNKSKYIEARLPPALYKRLEALVAQDVAAVLWNSKATMTIDDTIRSEICYIHAWLIDESRPWEIPIGHVIPRDTTIESTGDSSELALGAFSDDLQYWFCVYFSPELKQLIADKDAHINGLEFATILLQIVAYIVFLESPEHVQHYETTHGVLPQQPVLNSRTDNQVSENWTSRVSSKSESGQNLVRLYTKLLERIPDTKVTSSYLQGKLNNTADVISRPDNNIQPHLLTSVLHHQTQIFHETKRLRNYCYFQPSPEILSLISSLLRWQQKPTPVCLPKNLGQLTRAGIIGSPSVLQ